MQKYNVRKKMKKDRKYYYVIPETEEPLIVINISGADNGSQTSSSSGIRK